MHLDEHLYLACMCSIIAIAIVIVIVIAIAPVVFPGCIYPAACEIKENQRGAPCMQPCTHFFTGSTIPKIPLNRVAVDLALEMW